MNEHRIHLRRAWTGRFPSGDRRVDLPCIWRDREVPFALYRSFHWPEIDPTREIVRLEVGRMAGLVSVALNGRNLVPDRDEPSTWLAEIVPESGSRPELIVEIDAAAVPTGIEWGHVALFIGRR